MWYIIVGCFLVAACTGESLHADIIDNVRIKRQHQQRQPQQLPPAQPINYQPYNQAPARIKQILQQQQYRDPLIHLPAQPPPQLQQLQGAPSGVHRPAAPQPQPQQVPLAQPNPYSPKVQYGQAPQQPTYKGIQAQPAPVQQQPDFGPQGGYSPQYKSQYPQQPSPNALYRPGPQAGHNTYQAQQPQAAQGQYPTRNLPPHIQKIVDSAYQG